MGVEKAKGSPFSYTHRKFTPISSAGFAVTLTSIMSVGLTISSWGIAAIALTGLGLEMATNAQKRKGNEKNFLIIKPPSITEHKTVDGGVCTFGEATGCMPSSGVFDGAQSIITER